MPNRLSRLEKRLAQFLALTDPPVARPAMGRPRIDVVYLSEEDQDRLEICLHE